jgi:hypothetical protein
MSEELTQVAPPGDLSFREALVRRRRNASPGSRRRVATWSAALMALIPVHVMVFAYTGSPWSLLAVPLNPVALYTSLRAWAYADLTFYVASVALVVAADFVPFWML